MVVLVSGVTGQLGATVLPALGSDALALVRRRAGRPPDRRLRAVAPGWQGGPDRLVEGDVGAPLWSLGDDLERLREVDCLVNLAAVTDWAAGWGELYRVNTVGAANAGALARALRDRFDRPVRVVHVGSVFAAGGEDTFVTERLHPMSDHATSYERSKWLGERALLEAPAADGVSRRVIRLSSLTGGSPLRRRGLEAFLAGASTAKGAVVPYAPRSRLDVVTVDDASVCLRSVAAVDLPDRTILHVALGSDAPAVSTVLAAVNDQRVRRGMAALRPLPIPPRLVNSSVELADRFLVLGRRQRNRLLGLRYLTQERVYGRAVLARTVGDAALPRLDVTALAAALAGGEGHVDATPTGPFATFDA